VAPGAAEADHQGRTARWLATRQRCGEGGILLTLHPGPAAEAGASQHEDRTGDAECMSRARLFLQRRLHPVGDRLPSMARAPSPEPEA
jgi:hypothetical protein